ncbi:MAG: hypothetical protein M3022_11060 [Actinomycetota bacterium]|nr:hypothetical protein [Actinomycetota bacterium]
MSFFDEVDEPRTPPRSQPRRRRPSGGGRRPPGGQQSIQARRGIAAVALLIVVVLVALGVHSCQVSARNGALKDYTNSVSSLIQRSASTGANLFHVLGSGASASSAASLNNQINQARSDAAAEFSTAQGLSVPDETRGAQSNVVLAMRMRVDGITTIASEIQPALGTSTAKDAVTAIAVAMARFYTSDVLYKLYAAPAIAGALHSAGIAVGDPNGQAISGKQFVPDVRWLQPTYIASRLHVSLPGGSNHGQATPGLHGHKLNSVSVAGTTLQTGTSNTLTASPAPTFTLNYTNGGNSNESNVVCKVTVSGTSVSGQTTIPQTTAGQNGTCTVTLSSSPSTGAPQTVVATIEPVAGEKNTANNSLSFPVTFQ